MRVMPEVHLAPIYPSVENGLLTWLKERQFSFLKPEGLVSPAFPDSFAPSAFHSKVLEAAQKGVAPDRPTRHAGCEWVYRHVDQGKIGFSNIHLSLFRMLVFFEVHAQQLDDSELRQRTIETFCSVLDHAGLSVKDCLVTYFGGGSALGELRPPDTDVYNHWINAGVPPANLIPIKGTSNLTNVHRAGEPAGPRCEVFWRDRTGRPIEIGTVVFEKYLIDPRDERLIPSQGLVYGGAVGLERIAMASAGYQSIFEAPELQALVECVEDVVDPRVALTFSTDILQLVDAARALTILLGLVGLLSGRRGARMQKLANIINRCMRSLGVEEDIELIQTLVVNVCIQSQVNSGSLVSTIEQLIASKPSEEGKTRSKKLKQDCASD